MGTVRWERALVIGASSGIGEAIARRLASDGTDLALVARREDRLRDLAGQFSGSKVTVVPHDVRNAGEVPALFAEAARALGGLDLVVYAAGIMPRVGWDEYATALDLATIETNLSGAVAWLNEAADRFARAGEGTIIGISSVAGDRGRGGHPVYNATKAAMDTYLEALRARVARKGVHVLTAKPGYVLTDMIEGEDLPPFLPVASPGDAAAAILAAARSGKRVTYVPGWWRLIMMVTRSIPAPLFERLNL